MNVYKKPTYSNLGHGYGKLQAEQHRAVSELVRPHVDSYNWFLTNGLSSAIKFIRPVEFQLPGSSRKISLKFVDAIVNYPQVKIKGAAMHSHPQLLFPSECRRRSITYGGRLQAQIQVAIDNTVMDVFDRVLGSVPMMLKCQKCNLDRLTPAELVARGEESEEQGGYFIVNGNEKVVRLLVMTRRNFPIILKRGGWKQKGDLYTEYGIQMRCVRADQSSMVITLHYLSDGTINLCFTYNKQQYFIPIILILKALLNVADQYVFTELSRGQEQDAFYKSCITNMMRRIQEQGLLTQSSIIRYLGQTFRIKLNLPEWYEDDEIGQYLLDECICIHISSDNPVDKFNILVYMVKKLFTSTRGKCREESTDNPMNWEALTPGCLMLLLLKEKMESWLYQAKQSFLAIAKKDKTSNFTIDSFSFARACQSVSDITKPLDFLLATGNVVSKSGLGLMQATGLAVLAERINYLRFMAYFRAIHRGAFFTTMRTTAVRKLLPEAFGFICPVHTPDGTPCGLLNHMSAECEVVNRSCDSDHLLSVLYDYGARNLHISKQLSEEEMVRSYTILLDGVVVGYIPHEGGKRLVDMLRYLKVTQREPGVDPNTEIVFIEQTKHPAQYAGIYLFTSVARLMRPVCNLWTGGVEMVGTFEQVYLNICFKQSEAVDGVTSHQELSDMSMLSAQARLVPYSDHNQSPRNIYQCHMGKQSMGTPVHAWSARADNKLYRIQSPQTCMVRSHVYDYYNMDEYPIGTNAIIAVLSYTGYDMEDAMCINKGSYDRGFCHGSVYKSELIDLSKKAEEFGTVDVVFGCNLSDACYTDGYLDIDGLPHVGRYIDCGEPYYSYVVRGTGQSHVVMYKALEPAFVDKVLVLGNDAGTDVMCRASITLRIRRNPIIGDKFASRHGQKGICSYIWPHENMPFTETGIVPDIIFNPHGFPSRMTIGMMIELMGGKSAAIHGICHDATPFMFNEQHTAREYFGKCLKTAGYNLYGTEKLYSGIDGDMFDVDIFFGVVYYQRLRHMVADKYQVRTTGPVDPLTQQPVKGRKREGGIRVGEMERDALIAHGAAYLLQDRLLNCSDKSLTYCCSKCGSLLAVAQGTLPSKPGTDALATSADQGRYCNMCMQADTIEPIYIPFVFNYLVAELAAMNIAVKLDLSTGQ